MGKKGKLKTTSIAKIHKDFRSSQPGTISTDRIPLVKEKPVQETIPMELCINAPGIFLGSRGPCEKDRYVGILQGTEGNIMVVGGNGSGKSTNVAMPTLITWQGAVCATDIKGELSGFYAEQYRQGAVARPYIIFDPSQEDGPSYDPFGWLLQDNENNLFNNVRDIAMAIAPVSPEDREPFWAETEQGVLAAALLHYFKLGLSFSETMCKISLLTMRDLCAELAKDPDNYVHMLLGQLADMKPEVMANFDRGLRNKTMLFAADPFISHAFRGEREGAVCFNWDDLNHYNIFLRIPADRIEQWGAAINLVYSQLFRYLERRPEMHSAEGAGNLQTLLLMDEFARFGKLDMIADAISTLRSKNVNICLMIQSIAQLDRIYGKYERQVIFDNCQFQVILRANDADTQKYICELIGTCSCIQHGVSVQRDHHSTITGYGTQISETRDLIVHPHTLSTLEDMLLLTPYGFCRARKHLPNEIILCRLPRPSGKPPIIEYCNPQTTVPDGAKMNKGAEITSIETRASSASCHVIESLRHQQSFTTLAQNKGEQADRFYAIGKLVYAYLPELCKSSTGGQHEEDGVLQNLRAFLGELVSNQEMLEQIQVGARQRCIGHHPIAHDV